MKYSGVAVGGPKAGQRLESPVPFIRMVLPNVCVRRTLADSDGRTVDATPLAYLDVAYVFEVIDVIPSAQVILGFWFISDLRNPREKNRAIALSELVETYEKAKQPEEQNGH